MHFLNFQYNGNIDAIQNNGYHLNQKGNPAVTRSRYGIEPYCTYRNKDERKCNCTEHGNAYIKESRVWAEKSQVSCRKKIEQQTKQKSNTKT